jgi:hypothetical protein
LAPAAPRDPSVAHRLFDAGVTCGRTPLIQLSPKKTWEGFVGGAIGTLVASYALTCVFAQFSWMYCPRGDLSFGSLECDVPEPFVSTSYRLADFWKVLPDFVVEDIRPLLNMLPAAVQAAVACVSWTCMPAQMHAMALAAFASIIGPFGALPPPWYNPVLETDPLLFCSNIPSLLGLSSRVGTQQPETFLARCMTGPSPVALPHALLVCAAVNPIEGVTVRSTAEVTQSWVEACRRIRGCKSMRSCACSTVEVMQVDSSRVASSAPLA